MYVCRDRRDACLPFRKIGVEEPEHVRTLDRADALLLLQIDNALAKLFHLRPMHLRPEMVLGVIAVVKEKPVIDFPVAAHTPRNRLVRVRAVMTVIAVQVTEAVAKIPKRQEKEHEPPVDEMNRFRWHNDRYHEERRRERRQLDVAPEQITVIALPEFPTNGADIVAEETQEHVAPRIFRLAVVPVFVNGKPIDGFPFFVRPVGITLVMLHVDRVVVRLRKTTSDRLRDSKQPIKQF